MNDGYAAQIVASLQEMVVELRSIKEVLRTIQLGMTILTEKKPPAPPRP